MNNMRSDNGRGAIMIKRTIGENDEIEERGERSSSEGSYDSEDDLNMTNATALGGKHKRGDTIDNSNDEKKNDQFRFEIEDID